MSDQVVGGLAVHEWGDPAGPGVLMWPGLGGSSGYFASVAAALPGRAVAVDPPGFGRSEPMDPCTYDRLIDAAGEVVDACRCQAMIGHSLGAWVAVGVAARRQPGLRTIVLVDGGFLNADELAKVGPPVTTGRAKLSAWLEANKLRFPDWETAFSELAALAGTERTPDLEAHVRDALVEVDGEVRQAGQPDQMTDMLLAALEKDVRALARRIAVPTLLIACGRPPERRAAREKAWKRFAAASPLIELHVAEDWGHNPIAQDPEGSTRLIGRWLRAHL